MRFAYETEVTGLSQDADGVTLEVRHGADGESDGDCGPRTSSARTGCAVPCARRSGCPSPASRSSGPSSSPTCCSPSSRRTLLTVNAVGDAFAFIAPFGDGYYRVIGWHRGRNVADDRAPRPRRDQGDHPPRPRPRLRHARRPLDVPLPQRRAPGARVPGRPGLPRRGRRARAHPGRRPGHEHRPPGRRQPRLEAGGGRQRPCGRPACWTPTRPSATPSARPSCAAAAASSGSPWPTAPGRSRPAPPSPRSSTTSAPPAPAWRSASSPASAYAYPAPRGAHPLVGTRVPDVALRERPSLRGPARRQVRPRHAGDGRAGRTGPGSTRPARTASPWRVGRAAGVRPCWCGPTGTWPGPRSRRTRTPSRRRSPRRWAARFLVGPSPSAAGAAGGPGGLPVRHRAGPART